MGTTHTARGQEYVLTLPRPDKPGTVYAVSSFLIQHSANIPASHRHRGEPGRAVTWHAEHHVPLNGDQTVVFH